MKQLVTILILFISLQCAGQTITKTSLTNEHIYNGKHIIATDISLKYDQIDSVKLCRWIFSYMNDQKLTPSHMKKEYIFIMGIREYMMWNCVIEFLAVPDSKYASLYFSNDSFTNTDFTQSEESQIIAAQKQTTDYIVKGIQSFCK
ncbi:MAG: hypothetical protein ACOYN6_07950 [Ignavibacteria bacterium]